MAQPLLANRPGSQRSSNDDAIEEEDALLTGRRTGKQVDSPTRKWREIAAWIWAIAATAVVVILAVLYQQSRTDNNNNGKSTISGKRNLIFMVSDGMGPTSLSLTRSWRQYTDQLPWDNTLILDNHLIGQSRTRSSSSLVTDSAAGATAFSCGQKSYNGAISVMPNHEPCGSVMEAAKRMGYTTGLVVTTRITDATPAVFASHVRRREMEDEIAMQMVGESHPLGRMVDLMFGGGRCHFLPQSVDGGCRADETDVTKLAENSGWNYISTRKEFDNLGTSAEMPLMGLFAGRDIPYEVDRRHQDDTYPSLQEMTRSALEILSAATENSDQGFFVMIEGSRIDHAGHANDPAAQVHEVLEYDHAMSAVLDFINDSQTPTLMVATSDHETGGLATARQLHSAYPEYLWYPGVLANVSQSAEYTAHQYHLHIQRAEATSSEDVKAYLSSLASKSLGIEDATQDELDLLIKEPVTAEYHFADMVSRRAQTGWSSHGHSAADVNIYTSNRKLAKELAGNHENTDVGAFLRSFLDADEEVEKVTEKLQKHMNVASESWLGTVPEQGERLDGQDHLDHYHGDHKKRGCDACAV